MTNAAGEQQENAAIGSAIREALLLAATTGSDPHLAIGVVAYAAGFAAGAAVERAAIKGRIGEFEVRLAGSTPDQRRGYLWALVDIDGFIKERGLPPGA